MDELLKLVQGGASIDDISKLSPPEKFLFGESSDPLFKALRERDFGTSWVYPKLPQQILPLEKTNINTDWIGQPVYWATPGQRLPHKTGNPYRDIIQVARLPGGGNTVRINDTDYIYYYFMWAPKDNVLVNYGKKFSDQEVLDHIRNPDFPKAPRQPNVFGFNYKRKELLLFNHGIIRSYVGVNHGNADAIVNIQSADDAKQHFNLKKRDTLFGFFEQPEKRHGREYLNINKWFQYLYPRTFEDLALEYENANRYKIAFTAALVAPDIDARRKVYADLIEKYQIVNQITRMGYSLRKLDADDIADFLNIISELIESHEKNINRLAPNGSTNVIFPFSESLWSDEMHEAMVRLYRIVGKHYENM